MFYDLNGLKFMDSVHNTICETEVLRNVYYNAEYNFFYT